MIFSFIALYCIGLLNMSIRRLQNEYKQIHDESNSIFSIDLKNLYRWDILLFGPQDTMYEGGIFKCEMTFPKDYPNKPPTFKFITKMLHPNVYPDGKMCISILHEGTDEYNYESLGERWLPTHSVTTIVLSIASLLGNPNHDSAANIEASLEWRNDLPSYEKKIYRLVKDTQK